METIALIIMVSIVLEALVEYGKTIEYAVISGDNKTAITQAITIILGIALAFIFHLQLFNGALSEFYPSIAINQNIDMILTGILFSRGSNYFSDLVTKLQGKNTIEILGSEFIDEDFPEEEIEGEELEDEEE